MGLPPDQLIDELRYRSGDLLDRPPVQQWLRPTDVTLRQKGFRHVLEGDLLNGSELRFVMPWSAPSSQLIKPNKNLFEAFLQLAHATDVEIHKFASRYGPLLIYCHAAELDEHVVIVESCEVWRYFAACMKALLRMAARIHAGRSPELSDWDVIGRLPMAIGRTEVNNMDWLNPSPTEAQKSWRVMAGIVSTGRNRDRAMWERLVNGALQLVEIRPRIMMKGAGAAARPRLTISGSGLLAYLVLQLCLVVL